MKKIDVFRKILKSEGEGYQNTSIGEMQNSMAAEMAKFSQTPGFSLFNLEPPSATATPSLNAGGQESISGTSAVENAAGEAPKAEGEVPKAEEKWTG